MFSPPLKDQMFTGIVEEVGEVKALVKTPVGMRLEIGAHLVLADVQIGDSISVNGCCLTVVDFKSNIFYCDVVQETLKKTNLGQFQIGEKVNLERSVKLQTRMSGHLVQGHVDGIGRILSKKLVTDNSWWVTIDAPADILRYMIYKGSITVDGVSLTIADRSTTNFSFAMIPHTAQVTTLGLKEPEEFVNLEVDLIAKYVEQLIQPFKQV
jgi:riboflavin synthase